MIRLQPCPSWMSVLLVLSTMLAGGNAAAEPPLGSLPRRTMSSATTAIPGLSAQAATGSHARSMLAGSVATARLVGIARPGKYAALSASVGSTVVEVLVRTGDRVKAGQVLVRFDDRVPQAALKVAQAEAQRTGALSAAMVRLELAEQQLQRASLALQRRAGSQFEVDEKTAVRDQARAQVRIEQESQLRAQASLERAQAELTEYSIRAPFDGEIVQVHQQAGSRADRTSPVVTIADRRTLTVELHLPVSDFGTVSPGSLIPLRADAPVNRQLLGEVTAVSAYVNSASRTFRVELEISNADERLPAGFTVRQDGPVQGRDGLVIRPESTRTAFGR